MVRPFYPAFDVYASAPGGFKAIVKMFSTAADKLGRIVIGFAPIVNLAIVNAIEVQQAGNASPAPVATVRPADVTTYHNDNMRTGWNPTEAMLNPATVASSRFGLRRTLAVDGLVVAQPLFVAKYPVGAVLRNVLIVATEHDSVYAFDADSGALLWQRSLGRPQSSADVGCPDIVPEYGIGSTPVIDRGSGMLYVVSASEPSPKVFETTLDLATGPTKLGPVSVTASAVQSNGTKISFSSAYSMQRASLLLTNGSVYLGVGSHGDHFHSATSGWLVRYAAASLKQLAAFNTIDDPVSDGFEMGSICGSGFGPAADVQGSVFAVTGNGAFDAMSVKGHDHGMTVIETRSRSFGWRA
jgi:hypothetical protein